MYFPHIPKNINCNIYGFGELPIHKRGLYFNGEGITVNNIAFNYNGDWSKSGKWKITLYLESGKTLLYRPLEDLKIINDTRTKKSPNPTIIIANMYVMLVNSAPKTRISLRAKCKC